MIATVFLVLLLVIAISALILAGRERGKYESAIAVYREKVADRGRYNSGDEPEDDSFFFRVAAGITAVLFLVLLGFSTIYAQGVGSAKVIIDAGGKVIGYDDTPGWSVKAPWYRLSNWDLFSQTATYAGDNDGAPSYTGGVVSGQEVTSSVAGGAQVNFDIQITYSVDGSKVADLYADYRSQERFTKQVVEPSILATVRDIPTAYKPVDFRGEKRGDATQRMVEALNKSLNKHGVTVSLVTLQNIRFTDEVEQSIKNVEVAQQREAEAEANLRATQVSAQAQVVEAQAQAEANRILSESLTPALLQQRYLDTLTSVGKSGNLVIVPEGSTPFVQAPVQPKAE